MFRSKPSGVFVSFVLLCGSQTTCKYLPWNKNSQTKSVKVDEADTLRFTRQEGPIENQFFRNSKVASHVLLSTGVLPRVIFAFPGGNEGAAFNFNKTKKSTSVKMLPNSMLESLEAEGGFVGISGDFMFQTPQLNLQRSKSILGSVRAMRDYAEGNGLLHEEMQQNFQMKPLKNGVQITRTLFDGNHKLQVNIEAIDDGTQININDEGVQFTSSTNEIKLRMSVLTNQTQLTPIPFADIFNEKVLNSEKEKQALAFLTYQEKLLAGSWRFMTYFGRDTLMSVRLLMPILKPAVIEAALGSVLSRVFETGHHLGLPNQNPMKGQVAHEEDIGDWASFHHLKQGGDKTSSAAWHDYRMVDADFMLAPVLAEYLFNRGLTPDDQQKFLTKKTKNSQEVYEETYASAASRNLELVMSRASPFALAGSDAQKKSHLISLLPGEKVGDWRDSSLGLGKGITPYSLNASLVPAALRAAAQLYSLPAFGASVEKAALANAYALKWETEAANFFKVTVPQSKATEAVSDSCQKFEISPCLGAKEIESAGDQKFEALALDAKGLPIPVMHSDDGFLLLFNKPNDFTLRQIASRIYMTFPAGLKTDAGMLVANAVYANLKTQKMFTRKDYHGAVIWSWQQALVAAGLERQIKLQMERKVTDQDQANQTAVAITLSELKKAQTELWKVIQDNAEFRSFELWGWKHEKGQFSPVSFSTLTKDGTEANALQLWSTVFLAVQPP
jgi:hypothetical protein